MSATVFFLSGLPFLEAFSAYLAHPLSQNLSQTKQIHLSYFRGLNYIAIGL